MDEDTVYQVTKAFWDNIDQVTSEAPWAKALNLEFAAWKRGLAELHPGAARYYREVGVLNNNTCAAVSVMRQRTFKDFMDETCINWGSYGHRCRGCTQSERAGHEVIAFAITKPSVSVDQFVWLICLIQRPLQMP